MMMTTKVTMIIMMTPRMVNCCSPPVLLQHVGSLVVDVAKVVRPQRSFHPAIHVVQKPLPKRRARLGQRAERHRLCPQRVVRQRRPPLSSATWPRQAGLSQKLAPPLKNLQASRLPRGTPREDFGCVLKLLRQAVLV